MVGVEPRVVRVVRAAVGREAGPTSVSKRLTVGEWADTLGRFRHALAAGAIYDRELVSELYSTSGEYDLLAKIYVPEDKDVGHFLSENLFDIPGIVRTLTTMTFKAF